MDAAKLQAKIYKGYGDAAKRIGVSCNIYRQSVATQAVITSGNLIGTVLASFNSQDMTYTKANKYGQSLWYGVFDASTVNVGDVLVGSQGTFFVAAKQLHLPILLVQTNRIATLSHSPTLSQTGAIGSSHASDEVQTMVGVPASILESGKGASIPVPSDTKNSAWMILIPQFAGVVVNTNDIITDDLGRRYAVNTAELTDLGWRILAVEVVISKQMALGALMGQIR